MRPQNTGLPLLVLCAIFVFAIPALSSPTGNLTDVVLKFDTEAAIIHTTNEKFLSFAMDAIVIYNGYTSFKIGDAKLVKMMKHLSPAYWRIGGTSADRLTFSGDGAFSMNATESGSRFDVQDREYRTLHGKDWVGLNKMGKDANVDIIYDLNVLQRKNGAWDSSNSKELIDFSDDHEFPLHFELGNEPSFFKPTFDQDVTATELGKDFKSLKTLLNKYPRYENSLIIGPDLASIDKAFMKDFLAQAKDVLDVISWHQYYFDGSTATSADFTNPTILDKLINTINNGLDVNKGFDKKLWLGETSSAYGSGSADFSDKFIATYLWLDKLGLAAKMGLDVVVRQDLVNGHYALVDTSYNPNPDFWISVLHKKLVGTKVLSCDSKAGNKVRLYCQCTRDRPGFATIFGLNLENDRVTVKFEGLVPTGFKAQALSVEAYVLTSNGQPYEKNVRLNGVPLTLAANNELPDMNPKNTQADPSVEIPSHALGFWVVPASACN